MYLTALIAQSRGREEWPLAALPFFTAASMDLQGAGTLGLAHVWVCRCFSPHSEVLHSGFGPDFVAYFLLCLEHIAPVPRFHDSFVINSAKRSLLGPFREGSACAIPMQPNGRWGGCITIYYLSLL